MQHCDKCHKAFGETLNTGRQEEASKAEGNNGVAKAAGAALEGWGRGARADARGPRESHAEGKAGFHGGGEVNVPRMRSRAQVAAAAEVKPPRDAAPLGCCCACAGGPVSESSSLPPPPPPSLHWSLALSSFAHRRVRAPLAPRDSEAGEGVGRGC
jgi:hypothetical protein